MFADIRTEWRVSEIESKLQQKANSHEVYSLRSDVDRLEHSMREVRSEAASLRHRCDELQETLRRMEEVIAAMEKP